MIYSIELVINGLIISMLVCAVIDFFTVPPQPWEEVKEAQPIAYDAEAGKEETPPPFSHLSPVKALLSPMFMLVLLYSCTSIWRKMNYLTHLRNVYVWSVGKEHGDAMADLHNNMSPAGLVFAMLWGAISDKIGIVSTAIILNSLTAMASLAPLSRSIWLGYVGTATLSFCFAFGIGTVQCLLANLFGYQLMGVTLGTSLFAVAVVSG
eukprot:GHVU01068162.1.p1 GENE.GHVU01068162.1~~GHVU01068162.1.p1  ORF type:complete len:208 (-),score=14.68 GHVU01068162.1:864-1487(-)